MGWAVHEQMVRYVHNISMNDRYKFSSIHIHMHIIKYKTFHRLVRKLNRWRGLRRALNGIRFETLFGSRPRCLAPIRITYAQRSPTSHPNLLFVQIFGTEIFGIFGPRYLDWIGITCVLCIPQLSPKNDRGH